MRNELSESENKAAILDAKATEFETLYKEDIKNFEYQIKKIENGHYIETKQLKMSL